MKVGDQVKVVKEGIDDQFNGDLGKIIAIVNDDMIIVEMEVMYLSQPIVFHKNQLEVVEDGKEYA